MRVTELFTIFAFVKSLEQIYLSPEFTRAVPGSGISLPSWPPALLNAVPYPQFTPSFPGSGISLPSWPPALFNAFPRPQFTPSFPGSGISSPSWPPALLNNISYEFDLHLEVPLPPPVVAPVQVDPPVNETKRINAPTCISYISQIARPRFSPAPIIPPRPQPICLNRHIDPKFEVPGPKSPWIILSPLTPLPKSKLPKPPFCLPFDETDSGNNNDDSDNNESIWLSLLLSPTVLAAFWHFCRLLARRPMCNSALHPEPVDNQGVEPMPRSQPNVVMVRRKKVECRDRVIQPRVFISTLPSLTAGSDALVIIPQRLTEFNASATVSVPALTSVSKTETSSTLPDLTETTVTDLLFGIVPPTVDQAENTTPLCTLSSIPSSSAEPESALQSSLSRPPTPTLRTSLLPPLVFEENQFGPVSKLESASAANIDAVESSPSLSACENMIDASAASLPSPMPTPAKKSCAPTLETELPTEETATVDLLDAEMQESCSQSSTITVETLSDLISDSIWVPETVERTPENDVAPMTQTDLSNAEVQDCVLELIEAVMEISMPASLSDSIWALQPSEIIPEEDVAPIVLPPPSREAASGLRDSIWAAVPDVPTSSQVNCESANEHLNDHVTTSPPVEKKGVPSPPVDEASLPTTAVETHSQSSSPLSESIWASELTEATSEDIVAPIPLLAEKASGLQSSIWATVADVPKVVALPATSSTPPPRSTTPTPDVPKVDTPPMSLPTPPPSAKKVSGVKASIWADDTSSVATSSTSLLICEEDLLACEQSNNSVSASRWANAPDTPSTPRLSTRKINANRWKGRRGRSSCA
ncbi:hypothetical protein C0992_010354 [Termitomyces sp. T32_za158]|nr:hypothetical protein C0992_010354 [Termitomyces sp. T32_za158]